MATFTLAQAQELLKVLKEYDSPSRNSRGGAIRTEPWQLVLACYLHQASVDDVISSETSDYIINEINKLKKEAIVILVSHDENILSSCDVVYEIDGAKINKI